MNRQNSLHLFSLFLALFFLILLAGCATIEQEVTIFQDEEWESIVRVGISSAVIAMSGGEGEDMLVSEIESGRAEAEAQGGKVDLKREQDGDGNVHYTVSSSGQGYALLGHLVFNDESSIVPVIYNGEEVVQFRYTPDIDDLTGGLASYEMRLHAGEILESNGFQEDDGTVVWRDGSAEMYAVVRPKNSFPTLLILVGLIIAFVLVAAIVMFSRSRAAEN